MMINDHYPSWASLSLFPLAPRKLFSTMIEIQLWFPTTSLDMKNRWATECYEAPTLESIEKDSIYEHGSFIQVIPQKPCSFNTSPESGMHCAQSTHKDYNCLKVLSCKTFRRLVVDAYVYRKHCKCRGCYVVLTLQLKLHDTSTIGDKKGNASSMIAARGCSHGRAYDQKQSTTGR